MLPPIFIAQLRPTVGALVANRQKIAEHIERAKMEGAKFIVTPEFALTGYPPLDLLLLPEFLNDIQQEIDQLIPQTLGITLFLGAPRPNPHPTGKPLLNSCLVISDGRFIGAYDKQLLPTYDVFDERRYFEPGIGSPLFTIDGYRFALTICEDIWGEETTPLYHEDPIDKLEDRQIDLLINLSASPYHLQKEKERIAIGARIANELKCPFLLCNQVGGNDGLLFDGASFLLDEKRTVKALLPSFQEVGTLVSFDGPIAPPKNWEEELLEALKTGVADYCHKLGFKKVLLGLSGGIDSSVVAAIATAALGKENVTGVLLPSRYTSDASNKDAENLAKQLGIKTISIPIEAPHIAFQQLLEPYFSGLPADVTEENLQTRIRGVLLMALSNKWGALLLTTGNKSELATGYATLYGDMCGALAVIGDLTKGSVYRLGRYLNLPKSILEKEPTAELKPNQKDSDSLPPYDIVDRVVASYVEEHLPKQKIVERENVPLEIVEELIRKIHKNEFKRRQAPPVLRVTSKSFNLGRHFPIVERWR